MSPQDPQDPALLAARLSGRIVHDLAGPAQGLANAVALAEAGLDAAGRDEALALAAQVSQEIGLRLAFCRAAYAGAGVGGPEEVEQLARALFSRRARLVFETHAAAAPDVARQLTLILAQICAQAVAAGGETRVRLEADGAGWRLRLVAEGPKLRLDLAALDALAGREPQSRAGLWAVGALARRLVEAAGGSLAVALDPLALEARLPAAPKAA